MQGWDWGRIWQCSAEHPCSPAQVSLTLEEAALEHRLQDTALVGSILAQGLH